jgi:hypothetical protein
LTHLDIRKDDWNHCRIIAQGNRLQFFINRKLSSEFTDNIREGRLESGSSGFNSMTRG